MSEPRACEYTVVAMRRDLKATEAALGPDHPEAAVSLNSLANALEDLSRYGEAEP